MFDIATLAQRGWDDEPYSFLERKYSCCTTRPRLTCLKRSNKSVDKSIHPTGFLSLAPKPKQKGNFRRNTELIDNEIER